MIQGGGFEPGMIQNATKIPTGNEADNRSKNDRGTLAMARTADPHSATTEFFINVVDQIREGRTGNSAGHQDVPKQDVVIRSVTVA